MPIPTAVLVKLTDEERDRLEAWSRRPKTAQALALRSRIVLAAADGLANGEIAQRERVASDGHEVAQPVRRAAP